ncbi:xanthine dehydrogenase family protein subunit M [Thermomicrobium sp. 4228-Ro]|uniref:FAD binding domain-containing protein n=1 Tax=Thermomicrobium sp. 4228-Ro TaxID=2993937 RepID=UPI002248DE80|nr:xanthine dehydrogenase family protein subunit M [Thermomicrobium sp. 4228-Ro]MCX2728432.1 xanthine dehydrogenase family protein subunit M [Thermomicrobium sp. 4228-Ro]
MIPGPFRYRRAESLDEAIGLLAQLGTDAKVLSGGQSLIPMMKFRLAEPSYIVDINRVPGLDFIEERDGVLRIGALVRESALERSALVRARYPILHDTAEVIADPLVRNLATVGGNLAHGDPANDHPATMLALRAQVVARGPSGERVISIDDFFVDTFVTVLQPDEILTEIRIPAPPPRSGGAYLKFERKVGDYAIAAAAVFLALDEAGRIAQAGIGLTNLAYKPLRAVDAERVLIGQTPSEELFRQAAELAAQATDPVSDLRGPAEYKRAVARTMTLRALRRALERARASA